LIGQAFGTGRGSTEIRAKLVARIPVNRPPAAQVSSQLAQRIQNSSWVKTESPLQVTLDQGTATLRGVVASDNDRRLVERMAKLEPGVRRVNNLLTVAASPTPAQAQPTIQ
jgi:osmotically-inducible protein OsmY